jgi:hypothetical protein
MCVIADAIGIAPPGPGNWRPRGGPAARARRPQAPPRRGADPHRDPDRQPGLDATPAARISSPSRPMPSCPARTARIRAHPVRPEPCRFPALRSGRWPPDGQGDRRTSGDFRPDQHRPRGTGEAWSPPPPSASDLLYLRPASQPCPVPAGHAVRQSPVQQRPALPSHGRQRNTVGVIIAGLSAGQHARLSRRLPCLANFGRIAGVSIDNWRTKCGTCGSRQRRKRRRFTRQARRVVHEAGNPLTIIKGYLKILDGKLPEGIDVHQELSVLSEEIDRVAAIVRRLSEVPGAAARPPGGRHL